MDLRENPESAEKRANAEKRASREKRASGAKMARTGPTACQANADRKV
jgi:hypothetical protein